MSMVATSSRTASSASLDAAASVAQRVSQRQAQVRRAFVISQDNSTPPPLARTLRGGRGGEVRLKLYLSFLWFAANPPYDVTYPARAWAQLLDLPDPEVAGARRISDALGWLNKERLITVEPRPGLPSRVVLLNETGTAKPYTVPGATWRTIDPTSSEQLALNRYIKIPPSFWTSGWLQVLDGAAVAMLIIVMAEASGSNVANPRVWFSPDLAAKRYSLSPATRTKGLSQLTGAGLLTQERISAGRDPFDLRRQRNAYRLNLERLSDLASIDVPSPEGRR